MSTYVLNNPKFTWLDYLQAKSFEDSFIAEISSVKSSLNESTRSVIASHRETDAVIEAQAAMLGHCFSQGFEAIENGLVDIREGINELNSTFNWGFSQVLLSLGGLKDSIDELIRISRSPAKTWAYEKFRDAQDAFRRELFEEALRLINHAINGYESNTGYSLEHRYHILKGTIQLGNFRIGKECPAIIDLISAKSSFLTAAKCAKKDNPRDAGMALLSAGWACYCLDELPEALEYSRQATALIPDAGEAHFQTAKIGYRIGHTKGVEENIMRAVRLDRNFAIKAGTDRDFTNHQVELTATLTRLKERIKAEVSERLPRTMQAHQALTTLSCPPFASQQFISHEIAEVENKLKATKQSIASNTIFSCCDGLALIGKTEESISSAKRNFFQSAKKSVEQNLRTAQNTRSAAQNKESTAEQSGEKASVVTWTIFGILACFMLIPSFISNWNKSSFGNPNVEAINALFALIGEIIGIGIVGWIMFWIISLIGLAVGGITKSASQASHAMQKNSDIKAAENTINHWTEVERKLRREAAQNSINI